MNLTWHRAIFFAVLLGASMLPAAEEGLLYNVLAPTTTTVAGSDGEVQFVVLNRSGIPAIMELPPMLAATLTAGTRRWEVNLQRGETASTGPQTLAPSNFHLQNYRLTVPAETPVGSAVLEVRGDGMGTWKMALEIAAVTATTDVIATTQRPTTNLVRAEPAAAALRRLFADRLAPHEATYFIYGADTPGAKFQLSFKYKLLDFSGIAPQKMARTLQFAYTQRSLWDITGSSSPFYDTSYMPELMYQSLAPKPESSDNWVTWLGFQAAFKHESNGREGGLSRSLNIVYARPVFAFGKLDGWHLLAIPELYTYAGALDDNADIKDYRGFGKLHLVLGRNDGPSLVAAVWSGKDFEHTSTQLDLTFPVRTKMLNFETYLLVQYFNGYGESLISYNEKSETIRAGISLVR